tara:strand:- start:308 stop:628 length:321 start_codon:yes stop_codon:yes gene_type:complete
MSIEQYCEQRSLSLPRDQELADVVFFELGCDLADEIIYRDGEASDWEAEQWYTYHRNLVKLLVGWGFKIRGKALETDGLGYLSDFSNYKPGVQPLWNGEVPPPWGS